MQDEKGRPRRPAAREKGIHLNSILNGEEKQENKTENDRNSENKNAERVEANTQTSDRSSEGNGNDFGK